MIVIGPFGVTPATPTPMENIMYYYSYKTVPARKSRYWGSRR